SPRLSPPYGSTSRRARSAPRDGRGAEGAHQPSTVGGGLDGVKKGAIRMSDRDNDGGFFGVIEAILAIIGALTVMGVLAVAASVLAWEMELRKSEQENALRESPTVPTA